MGTRRLHLGRPPGPDRGKAQEQDRNGDGAISWSELQDFVHEEVLKITKNQQRPKFAGEYRQDFPIFEL